MKNLRFLAFSIVFLFALPVLGFGPLGSLPKKPVGNADDMNKFVGSADTAYSGVLDLASAIPDQVGELSEGVLGLKDMKLDATAKEKFAGLKQELADANKAVRTPKVHEIKAQKEAHARLDKAMDGLMGYMKETLATDTAKKALGASEVAGLKTKAQGYVDQDTNKIKDLADKLLGMTKTSPAAATAYGIGLADDYTAQLQDGTKVKAKDLDELVKGASDNLSLWKGFTEKRLLVLKGVAEMLAGGGK